MELETERAAGNGAKHAPGRRKLGSATIVERNLRPSFGLATREIDGDILATIASGWLQIGIFIAFI